MLTAPVAQTVPGGTLLHSAPMAYRRDDIERVRAATDLVELVGEITKVKRSGRSTMAVCPFHQEKTPSLSVDGARGLYHCFGCGKSGDLFRWVQETQNVDFTDAVELLARRAGITLHVEPGAARRRGEREELVAAVRRAVDFYQDTLRTGADAGPARAYLRGRGYDAGTVERFELGFSPPGWDALVGHLRHARVPEKAVLGAGLAVRSRRGRLVDRFRGRVMFPIFDLRGDPVGFGARRMEGGEGPKYLNSPETPLYHKSRLLYGLNQAKGEIVRAGWAVVVEGYTDVIGMAEAGMPVAVATCGTALGSGHFDLLRRFTERVVLAFDADAAGAGASVRGFEQSIPGDLDLRVAALPEGKDPADLVSGGEVELLREALEESEPLLQFRIERELRRFELDEPEARARAVRAAAAIVARHPDAVARHEYALVVARLTGVDAAVVESAVRQAAGPQAAEPPPEASRRRRSGHEKAERELLRLLLANDRRVRELDVGAADFFEGPHRVLYEQVAPAIEALPPGEEPDLGALVGDGGDLAGLIGELALDDRPLAEAVDVLRRVRTLALDRRIEDLERKLAAAEAEGETETYTEIFKELVALQRTRKEMGGPS